MKNRIFILMEVILILFASYGEPQNAYKQKLSEMGLSFSGKHYVDSIVRDDIEAVQLFLLAGMSPEKGDQDRLPLVEATRRGYSDIALALIDAFENKLWPADRTFKPDALLVFAGFDSRTGDPLGRFRVTDRGYQRLTQILLEIAQETAEGRLISALEGGYSLEGLSKAVPAHIAALMRG